MFLRQQSQQTELYQSQQHLQQSTFSESMMIGEIHLNNEVNGSVVQTCWPQPKYLCSECTFEKTLELSQQILGFREKLIWFDSQTRQLEEMAKGEESTVQKLLPPLQTAIDKEIPSEEQAQRQLKHLQNQLSLIEHQLHHQQLLSHQYDQSFDCLIQERILFQQQLFKKQDQYRLLAQHYHQQILLKHQLIQNVLNTFQTTNFVSVLYTITFENNRSYLNGERITHENSWKIVQILLFYQTKYDAQYHPLYHVFWSQMKLEKDPEQQTQETHTVNLLESINLGNLLRKQSAKEVDIDCDSEQLVLNKWMPCLLVEVRQLFHFINRQANKQQKIRYEISREGEFQLLKGKTLKSPKDKFQSVIKYLMANLDQINKIEFFARENRVNAE